MKASVESLQDVRQYLDRAMEGNGILLTFETPGACSRLRHRCYQLRLALREQSKRVAEDPSDPAWNISLYDALTFHQYTEEVEGIARYRLKIVRSEELGTPSGLLSVEDL